jgi:peptidylprolyl isomerase
MRALCLASVVSLCSLSSGCHAEPEKLAEVKPAVAVPVDGLQPRTCDAACAAKGKPGAPAANPNTPKRPELRKPPTPAQPGTPQPITYPAGFKGQAKSKRTTASGLQIEEFAIGTGAEAKKGSEVDVHYSGWVKSTGLKFDSSYDRNKPLTIPIGVGSVIKGWDEGVVGMKVGGKRRLSIPAAIAYGDRGFGSKIPPGSDLIFVVELVDSRPPPPPPQPASAFKGTPVKQWKTPEGVEITVYKEGKGPALAAGQTASIHYTGTLDNGTQFDSSVARNKPFGFPLGQGRVIKGWDIGAKGMKVGELRKLVIPAELAYGERERGKIPANSRLTFTMELMGIR